MDANIRSCIFCGAHPLTKEDAWPLWLMRLLYTNASGTMEYQRGIEELQPWPSKEPRLIMRCVCANCNNGWMSELEGKTKPLVEMLLSAKPILIDAQQQAILSAWAVKSAMVFEGMKPSEQPWFYVQTERETLMNSLQLPRYTSVWIAKHVNNNGPYCSAYSTTGIVIESESQVSGYITTMIFGELAIQILNIRLSESISQDSQITLSLRSGPWNQATLRIYPQNEQISWPPKIGFADESGLQAFEDRWKPQKSD